MCTASLLCRQLQTFQIVTVTRQLCEDLPTLDEYQKIKREVQ